jgi:hypothetical protein
MFRKTIYGVLVLGALAGSAKTALASGPTDGRPLTAAEFIRLLSLVPVVFPDVENPDFVPPTDSETHEYEALENRLKEYGVDPSVTPELLQRLIKELGLNDQKQSPVKHKDMKPKRLPTVQGTLRGAHGHQSSNGNHHSGNTGHHGANTGHHGGNKSHHGGNTGHHGGNTGHHGGNTGHHSTNAGSHRVNIARFAGGGQ